jgi:tetratricopeptide (TPR) repeat protein
MKSALAGLTPTASEEAARVRARLGTALRRIGRYEEAAQHLYRAIAEAPDAFTRARAQSEAGVLEAARHHPWEALSLTAEAERYLRGARERRSEALYRYRRTIFRLAVAYWVWESGDPYRPPFRGGQPAPQAQRLLEGLWKELQQESPKGDRYTGLMLDTALMLSLLLEPAAAQALMHPFLRLENPYLRDQARLAYADAMGREGRWGEVLAQLVQLSGLETDPGTQVWKSALEAQALLGLKQEEAAWERLQNLGYLPEPFRVQLGRLLGRVWPPKLLKERLGPFQPLEAGEALALWLLRGSPIRALAPNLTSNPD